MVQYLAGTHYIQYGTRRIEYELVYVDRSDLAIHVHPDRSIVVEAPFESDPKHIESKLQKRAKWILKQQRLFEDHSNAVPHRQYVSGETHMYLGRQYRLKVIEADFDRVKFNRGRIYLFVNDPSDWQRKHDLLQKWYRTRARFIFQERLDACFERLTGMGIPYPELQIRRMKSQWGSCSNSGNIILNLKLIQMPKRLIDYVVIHELCHLKEHNHSQAFYRLLDQMLPHWSAIREELNQWGY